MRAEFWAELRNHFEKDLPVFVQADSSRLDENSYGGKKARECTENCDRTGAAREIGSMADSRGWQNTLGGESQPRLASENTDMRTPFGFRELDSSAQSLCGEFSKLLSDTAFEK